MQSSKDVGFIAVDAAACSGDAVEWALFRVDETGTKTPLSVTAESHGKGKSCQIPAEALKFDELEGRHFLVCASGAQSADLYVKSIRAGAA